MYASIRDIKDAIKALDTWMKEPDMKYKSRMFFAVIDLLHFGRARNMNGNITKTISLLSITLLR